MKTTQRQSSWPACQRAGATQRKNRHGGYGLQVLLLMLVMLVGGGSPAWAYWSADTEKTLNDPGGGTCKFTGKSEWGGLYRPVGNSGFDFNGFYYASFITLHRFNMDEQEFVWTFDVKMWFFEAECWDYDNNKFKGEVYVVTSDDVKHLVATWFYNRSISSWIQSNWVDEETWGKVVVSGYGYYDCLVTYAPSGQAVEEGVKAIVMKHSVSNDATGGATMYEVQYEKDIQFSGIAADKPMPNLTIDWDTDGKLAFKATDVPDKRTVRGWRDQYYDLQLYYYNNGQQNSNASFGTTKGGFNISNVSNGKMDVAFSYWPLTTSEAAATCAYTVPVYVKYQGCSDVKYSSNFEQISVFKQPSVAHGFIKPYTRPATLDVQFDKWNKKNVVTWTPQTEAKGYDGTTEVDVACRNDGKWYVIRYDKNSPATDYKVLSTLKGDAATLQFEDADIAYDKEYKYRVIFLPDILENLLDELDL